MGRPKKVEFSKGTKKASALKKTNEGMAAEIIEIDTCDVSKISSDERLADSGTSRHICNDIRMLWNAVKLDVPVTVRQLVGEVAVHTCGIVKIEFENEAGVIVQIDLFGALLVPDLRVNSFNLVKMRQASIRLEYLKELGRVWISREMILSRWKYCGETNPKLPEVVALRSTKAENMALTHALEEGLFLQKLQVEMGVDHEVLGVLLMCDNQSSTKIAKNHIFHKRNDHIANRDHFIWEKVESGEMELHFVKIKAMAADQLTRNVGLQVLVAGKDFMGMLSG